MPNDREMVKLTVIDHYLPGTVIHVICSPHLIRTKLYGVSTIVIPILQMRK